MYFRAESTYDTNGGASIWPGMVTTGTCDLHNQWECFFLPTTNCSIGPQEIQALDKEHWRLGEYQDALLFSARDRARLGAGEELRDVLPKAQQDTNPEIMWIPEPPDFINNTYLVLSPLSQMLGERVKCTIPWQVKSR